MLRLGVIVGFLSCIVGTICGDSHRAPEVESCDAGHPGLFASTWWPVRRTTDPTVETSACPRTKRVNFSWCLATNAIQCALPKINQRRFCHVWIFLHPEVWPSNSSEPAESRGLVASLFDLKSSRMMRLEEEFKHMYVEEAGMEYASEAWTRSRDADFSSWCVHKQPAGCSWFHEKWIHVHTCAYYVYILCVCNCMYM